LSFDADIQATEKRKRQHKRRSSDASSSDGEPNYGKRSRYEETARSTDEEHHCKPSSHPSRTTNGHKRSQSAEREKRRHEDRNEAGNDITGQKIRKQRERETEACSPETSRRPRHSAAVKQNEVRHRDSDRSRSRSRSVDVDGRHRKDKRDSDGDFEKQRKRRPENEHSHYSSRKHMRDSDEDRQEHDRSRRWH